MARQQYTDTDCGCLKQRPTTITACRRRGAGGRSCTRGLTGRVRRSGASVAELVAGKREVIVRIGVSGIEAHRQPQMLPRCLDLPGFFEHVAQVELGDGTVWV